MRKQHHVGRLRESPQSLRLAYSLANSTQDGKFRKIKVELMDQDGKPLVVTDQKGKKIKAQVFARQGYQAPSSSVN
jgi:hypothetical protein